MILTYQLKHTFDVSVELEKAKQVAEFSVKHRTLSSADVSHIGLKSAIANQILRKYGKNRKTKRVHSVNLVIPSQSIKVDQVKQTIKIACLKLEFSYRFRNDFSKINSIEISANRIFVSATFPEEKAIVVSGMLGVDRNATGHLAVAADATRGKVIKLGKAGPHIRRVYSKLRRRFQQKANYRKIKAMEKREARRTRDLNHKISAKLVSYAKENNLGISLEQLGGIRKSTNRRKKYAKRLKQIVNNWSFYQLESFIKYKAKLHGVSITYVDPAYTSQLCSQCGLLGERVKKSFKCPHCGHVEHADVNAAFNISLAGFAAITSESYSRGVLTPLEVQ